MSSCTSTVSLGFRRLPGPGRQLRKVARGRLQPRPKGEGPVGCRRHWPETGAAFTWGSFGGELPCHGQVDSQVALHGPELHIQKQVGKA